MRYSQVPKDESPLNVGQHLVARGQVQQEPAHARLVGLDEPAECVPVVGQGALRQQSYFIKFGKHGQAIAMVSIVG